ncbi:MAG: twin-arginine translocase TatA/TatE family subunit [Nitrospirae bacterium]|nr:twin-arginine translocase TatA/TatE family subunit [Nitrospirota bacterium]
MFGLGLPEIILILVIVLIVFGVGKLPEIGSGLGKAIRGFKKGLSEPSEPDVAPKKDNSDNKKT